MKKIILVTILCLALLMGSGCKKATMDVSRDSENYYFELEDFSVRMPAKPTREVFTTSSGTLNTMLYLRTTKAEYKIDIFRVPGHETDGDHAEMLMKVAVDADAGGEGKSLIDQKPAKLGVHPGIEALLQDGHSMYRTRYVLIGSKLHKLQFKTPKKMPNEKLARDFLYSFQKGQAISTGDPVLDATNTDLTMDHCCCRMQFYHGGQLDTSYKWTTVYECNNRPQTGIGQSKCFPKAKCGR